MTDNSAIKPNTFNIAALRAEEVGNKVGATDEEKYLYALTNTKGYRILKEYKDRLLKEVDDATKFAIAEGKPFEEIGKNTVVINLAKDIIEKLFNRVEDAKEICESKIDEKED
jgi:nitrate/TMAO reductase-like tetraheme cytochrome c subunit